MGVGFWFVWCLGGGTFTTCLSPVNFEKYNTML